MRKATAVSLVAVLGVAIALVLIAYGGTRSFEVAVPLLGDDGKLGAKFITVARPPSGLLASTLIKIRGASAPRDALYDDLLGTQSGQILVHGPNPPDDLHLAECAPTAPMPATEVFQGLGPGNANAWGYRYADQDAVFETTCVKGKLNAVPPQAVDPCFLGAGAGVFFGQADNFPFVNTGGILNIPTGDPYAFLIASMKVVLPQTHRNERCTMPPSPVCGDEFIDAPETCEDGNLTNGDGCSSTCQTTTQCNDGVDNSDLEDTLVDCADPGCHTGDNLTNPCVPTDNTEGNTASCGNGFPDAGEQCDDGNPSNFDACLVGCTNNICGDGFPVRADTVSAPGEACDDGKQCANGTVCTSDAQCGGAPGSCAPRSGDGCSAACITEDRYNCEWKSALGKDECTIPLGGGV